MVSLRRLLLSVICLAAGAFWLYRGAGVARDALASDSWPTANGKIVASEIVPENGYGVPENGKFVARIVFSYDVGGVEYESNRLAIGRVAKARTHPDAVVRKYPVGRFVKVAYDPAQPTSAALEPGLNLATALPALLGVLLVLASFVFFVLGRVSTQE
ncbi:MAG: DUF3592 domain-containing protein [Phycisphaerales bacterium JB039]